MHLPHCFSPYQNTTAGTVFTRHTLLECPGQQTRQILNWGQEHHSYTLQIKEVQYQAPLQLQQYDTQEILLHSLFTSESHGVGANLNSWNIQLLQQYTTLDLSPQQATTTQ